MLGEIRRLTKFASLYEDEFVKEVIGHSQQAEQTDRKLKEKELQTLLARDEELEEMCIRDSKNGLQKATSPYYTEESNHSEHFGLGLYICKRLCEHHNGYLKIENTASGAKVSAYFKSPAL